MKDTSTAVIHHFIPKGSMQYDMDVSVVRATNADKSISVKLSIQPISIYLDGLEYVEELSSQLHDLGKVFDEISYALKNSNAENEMVKIKYCGVELVHMIMSLRYIGADNKRVALDFVLSADGNKVRKLFGKP